MTMENLNWSLLIMITISWMMLIKVKIPMIIWIVVFFHNFIFYEEETFLKIQLSFYFCNKVLGTDESTDEILSRLLKEHEARITYKLLTEDFLGNNEFNGEDGNDDLPETLRLRYKVRKENWYVRRIFYIIKVGHVIRLDL